MDDPANFPLTCRDAADSDRPISGWRANVGRSLSLDLSGEGPGDGPIALLNWNVWIGRGDLAGLIARIRSGQFAGCPAGAPFVALIQEAFRADDSIPARSNGFMAKDYSRRGSHEHDIAAIARALGLNLRYAPSMRNGESRSDRGSAILSSLPLVDASACELAFSMQRRVAVSASVTVNGRPIRFHSAHLDPRGRTARDLLGIAGRLRQARGLLEVIRRHPDVAHVIGADLNLARQRREPAYRALVEAGFAMGVPAREPEWRHTYHRLPRLLLDWLLVAGANGTIRRFDVRRLDESPADAGPYVFGSDHHPLLARIDLL